VTGYLIWDFDGTLAYREGMWAGALLAVLEREVPGLEAGVEALRPHLRSGFPWHDPGRHHPELGTAGSWWDALNGIFESAFVGAGVEPERARRMAKLVRHEYVAPEAWRLFDDTLPALDLLASRGWTHLVLSNHVPELPEIARHLGLDGWIARVFNSAESGYEKPHPRAFDGVLEVVGETGEAWMIGDSVSADIVGAEAVGLRSILVRGADSRAGRCCRDLVEVARIIRGAR
jgi:putative hydrolase of the HAD superfamily